jgi:general secretion pathway protein D
MTPKILAPYEKGNSDNVKDLLNRRQAHLKNTVGDDDAFATTVKGIYDKAKKQGEGPLYDTAEASKYIDKSNNEAPAYESKSETEVPDYQQILEQAEKK